MRRYLTTMQVNPDNSPKSEYLPDQIHSDQVPTWLIVQNLSEYLMPNPASYIVYIWDLRPTESSNSINLYAVHHISNTLFPKQVVGSVGAYGRCRWTSSDSIGVYGLRTADYRLWTTDCGLRTPGSSEVLSSPGKFYPHRI